jgi:tetratricopeptide (TPR) repeat protein
MEVLMRLKLYTIIVLAFSLLAVSCKTANKLYQKGNYDGAVELAAKKLQKDPNDAKTLEILQSSYRFAVEDHESRIRSNSESRNELRWEWTYNEYLSLQRMYEAIRKVPEVYQLVKPTDYSSYLVSYAEKAGDVRHDRGLSLMQNNDKTSYRNAYRELRLALSFKPGNRDIQQKMAEAYEYAVVNVIVMPIEERGYRYSTYNNNYGNGGFTETLLRNLQYNSGSEFVKFYSAWDARSRDIRADEIIDMRFRDINVGNYRDSRSTRRVSKDVVIKETVYRPDSIVKEYAKVHADITTTTRTMLSEGLLQVNIRDGEGRRLWTDNFRKDHSWTTQFATYTGDERALSDSDKQLLNRRQETQPSESDVIRYIMEQIEQDALQRIKNYYGRLN